MSYGQGTVEINFGVHPGNNEASIAITGQTSISATSSVEAYVMADDTTTTHTANDHKYFVAFASLTCGTPTAGTGFTIYARSLDKLSGSFKVHYIWSD